MEARQQPGQLGRRSASHFHPDSSGQPRQGNPGHHSAHQEHRMPSHPERKASAASHRIFTCIARPAPRVRSIANLGRLARWALPLGWALLGSPPRRPTRIAPDDTPSRRPRAATRAVRRRRRRQPTPSRSIARPALPRHAKQGGRKGGEKRGSFSSSAPFATAAVGRWPSRGTGLSEALTAGGKVNSDERAEHDATDWDWDVAEAAASAVGSRLCWLAGGLAVEERRRW